jgi:hypothetical protein
MDGPRTVAGRGRVGPPRSRAMMPRMVTFCGIRRGVGNATIARAFAVSAVETNDCVLLEADRRDDTSVDWAERRRKATRYGLIEVRSVKIEDWAYAAPPNGAEDIIVLQTVYSDDGTAVALAKKSRLFVLSTTPSGEDVEAIERLLGHMLDQGIDSDSLAVVLSNPAANSSESDISTALRRFSRTGTKAFDLPFLGRHAAGPLKEMGRTIAERIGTLPPLAGERPVDFLQKAYVDRS